MNRTGKARNARINQAKRHLADLHEALELLSGFPSAEHVDNPDAWQDGRNALEQLTQCFHEASAYNSTMGHAIEGK
jgi:hypothetical protein